MEKDNIYIYRLEEEKEEENNILVIDDYMDIIHKISRKINSMLLPKEGRYSTYRLFKERIKYSELLNNLGNCSCLIKDHYDDSQKILVEEKIELEESNEFIKLKYINELGLKIILEIKIDTEYILEIYNEDLKVENKEKENNIYNIEGDIILNCKKKELIIECPISDEKDELGLIYSIITRILDFDKYINIKREYYNTSEDLIDLEINPDKYEEIYYPIIEKENIQKKQYKKYPEPLWLKDIFDIIEDKEREKNLLDIGYIQIEIKDLEYKIKEIEAKINLKNKIKSIEEIEEYEKFFIKEEINSKNNNKVLKILAKINKEYITQKHKNYRYLNLKKGKELKIREINIKEGTLLNIREIIELEKRYKLNKLLEL